MDVWAEMDTQGLEVQSAEMGTQGSMAGTLSQWDDPDLRETGVTPAYQG